MSAAEDIIPAAPCACCFEDHPSEAHTAIGIAADLAREAVLRRDWAAAMRWIDVIRKLDNEREES